MAEAVKKTGEEELLESVKAGEGASADKKAEDDADERSPEQKIIDELKGKLGESEKRAAAAENQRDAERAQKDTARKEATTAAGRQIQAQEDAIKSNLNAAKSDFEAARKDWDEAYDAGDKAKIRDAQEKLNDAQMRFRGAEINDANFKKWKESNKETEVSGTVSKFTPKEQAWIDKNPRFNTDSAFREAVFAADAIARTRNIEIDSDAYFSLIETRLKKEGLMDDDSSEEQEDEPKKKEEVVVKKTEKKSASTATPVGNSTGSGSGGGKKHSFTLTPEMREAASFMWPDEYKKDPAKTEEKYAKYQMQIAKDKAEGKL